MERVIADDNYTEIVSDSYAEEFSTILFEYIWHTENFISDEDMKEWLIGTDKDVLDFATETAKAVIALAVLSGSKFVDTVTEHFKKRKVTRRNVFTFLSEYTFQHHEETKDIFRVVLDAFTFIYNLFLFCMHKGKYEYVMFGAMCWMELFKWDLRKDFKESGGWYMFRVYVMESRYVENGIGGNDPTVVNTFMNEITSLFPRLTITDQPVDVEENCKETTVQDPVQQQPVDESSSEIVDEASAISFGTVEHIALEVPGFNEESNAVVFEFDDQKPKIVKRKELSNLQSCVKAILRTINPEIKGMIPPEIETCPEDNSIDTSEADDFILATLLDFVSSQGILKRPDADIEQFVENNYNHKIYDNGECFVKCVNQPENCPTTDSNRENEPIVVSDISEMKPEGKPNKDDKTICQDLISVLKTVNPSTDNSDKWYVNGQWFDKYVNIPVKDSTTDCGRNYEPGGISEGCPEKHQTKDDRTISIDLLSSQETGNSNADNVETFSEKLIVNGVSFDKYVYIPENDVKTVSNEKDDSDTDSSDERIDENQSLTG